MDGQRAAEVRFESVRVDGNTLLGKEGDAFSTIKRAQQSGILALCAEATGIMESLYKDTAAYTQDREQFDRPMSEFQVIQHRLVDMFMEYEQCKSLLLRATMETVQDPVSSQRTIHALKHLIGKSGIFVGESAVQTHGGMGVTEELRIKFPEFYKILTEVKVRFRFVDKEVILENISPLIELNDDKSFKQVRFSPRLDYVPILEKEKLDLYYQARKKISEMYNSDKYRIEFKLEPKDLMMMDNHRLLHGRTAYETKEGERFLQGCYIDYDSTEGKLRHLKRKFNL